MTALTFEVLDGWIEEFKTLNMDIADGTKVIVQDGDGGRDTGLIGVALQNASTSTYLQPESTASGRWVATFEARDTPVVQDAAALLEFSQEIATLAALCTFLQAKTNELLDPADEAA